MAKASVKVQGGKIQHGKATTLSPSFPRNVVVAYPGNTPKIKKG